MASVITDRFATDHDVKKAMKKAIVEKDVQQLMVYPAPGSTPTHPEWFATYMVTDRKTMEFLGFIGQIGYSETWGYDNGLPGSKGKGRAQGKDAAAMKLWQAANR